MPKGKRRPADSVCRVHRALKATPAMQAGLTDHIWAMDEIVGHMDVLAPKPNRPRTHTPRGSG